MQGRILAAVLFGCALAFAGAAQAQKTVLPGHPSTPPPKSALPGNPTTPPPMRSPDTDGTLGSGTMMDRGSQGPNIGSGNLPSSPGLSIDEARRRFDGCLKQHTRDGRVSENGMANCVAGWMPSDHFSRFNNCWRDPKTTAWECFGRAYN